MSSIANIDEKFYVNDKGVYFKSEYPSQWFIAPFIIDGVRYNCCEQYMMAEKARFFGDYDTEALIMEAIEPKEQKKLGRSVANFDEKRWAEVACDVVFRANLAKFSQNSALKALLLATGSKKFVECSPYDKIWGNGLNITDTLATPEEQWEGTNLLGQQIMRVRDTLRA